MCAGGRHEIALHLRALAGAQQPVVDEDTGQPVADGALHQSRGHRGIHPPGQPTDRMPVADLRTHLLDQGADDVGGRPLGTQPREVVQKPAEHLLPMRAVHHLRVVLHPGQAALGGLERGHRGARAAGHHIEPVRCHRDRVTMAHPHRLYLGQTRMQLAAKDFQLSPTVLAGTGAGDGPTERLRHRLKPVADAEHRQAQVEQGRVQSRGVLGVDAGRSTGKDERQRAAGLDLGQRRGVADHL